MGFGLYSTLLFLTAAILRLSFATYSRLAQHPGELQASVDQHLQIVAIILVPVIVCLCRIVAALGAVASRPGMARTARSTSGAGAGLFPGRGFLGDSQSRAARLGNASAIDNMAGGAGGHLRRANLGFDATLGSDGNSRCLLRRRSWLPSFSVPDVRPHPRHVRLSRGGHRTRDRRRIRRGPLGRQPVPPNGSGRFAFSVFRVVVCAQRARRSRPPQGRQFSPVVLGCSCLQLQSLPDSPFASLQNFACRWEVGNNSARLSRLTGQWQSPASRCRMSPGAGTGKRQDNPERTSIF